MLRLWAGCSYQDTGTHRIPQPRKGRIIELTREHWEKEWERINSSLPKACPKQSGVQRTNLYNDTARL
jgi:hypothetical protein